MKLTIKNKLLFFLTCAAMSLWASQAYAKDAGGFSVYVSQIERPSGFDNCYICLESSNLSRINEGMYIPSVTYSVFKQDGTFVKSYTSSQYQSQVTNSSEDLEYGDYYMEITDLPSPYYVPKDSSGKPLRYEFTVSEDNKVPYIYAKAGIKTGLINLKALPPDKNEYVYFYNGGNGARTTDNLRDKLYWTGYDLGSHDFRIMFSNDMDPNYIGGVPGSNAPTPLTITVTDPHPGDIYNKYLDVEASDWSKLGFNLKDIRKTYNPRVKIKHNDEQPIGTFSLYKYGRKIADCTPEKVSWGTSKMTEYLLNFSEAGLLFNRDDIREKNKYYIVQNVPEGYDEYTFDTERKYLNIDVTLNNDELEIKCEDEFEINNPLSEIDITLTKTAWWLNGIISSNDEVVLLNENGDELARTKPDKDGYLKWNVHFTKDDIGEHTYSYKPIPTEENNYNEREADWPVKIELGEDKDGNLIKKPETDAYATNMSAIIPLRIKETFPAGKYALYPKGASESSINRRIIETDENGIFDTGYLFISKSVNHDKGAEYEFEYCIKQISTEDGSEPDEEEKEIVLKVTIEDVRVNKEISTYKGEFINLDKITFNNAPASYDLVLEIPVETHKAPTNNFILVTDDGIELGESNVKDGKLKFNITLSKDELGEHTFYIYQLDDDIEGYELDTSLLEVNVNITKENTRKSGDGAKINTAVTNAPIEIKNVKLEKASSSEIPKKKNNASDIKADENKTNSSNAVIGLQNENGKSLENANKAAEEDVSKDKDKAAEAEKKVQKNETSDDDDNEETWDGDWILQPDKVHWKFRLYPSPSNKYVYDCDKTLPVHGRYGEYFDYHFDKEGYMVTGWYYNRDKKKWFYYDTDGAKVYGWKKINEKWYFFNNDKNSTYRGEMFENCSVNGYKLGADGALIEN